MNVSRITPAAAGSVSPDAADADARVRAPQAPASSASADRSDRFELSDAARAHQAEVAAHKAEVETARAALHADGALSPERVAELRQRAESGFYDSPEVVEAVAGRTAADLRAAEG